MAIRVSKDSRNTAAYAAGRWHWRMAALVTVASALIAFPIAYYAARYAQGKWKALFYLGVMKLKVAISVSIRLRSSGSPERSARIRNLVSGVLRS